MFISMNMLYLSAACAAVILFVVYCTGYVYRERQNELYIKSLMQESKEHRVLREHYEALFDDADAQLDKVTIWKNAVMDLATINFTVLPEGIMDDPRAVLARVIDSELEFALDPRISKQAKNLITRGVRQANKKARAKAERVALAHAQELERTKTVHTNIVSQMRITRDQLIKQASNAQFYHSQYQGVLVHVLEQKVKLSSVRKNILNEINSLATKIPA